MKTIKRGRIQLRSNEAVSALISLGYKPSEASRYVLAIAEDDMSSEELIRKALKHSVKK